MISVDLSILVVGLLACAVWVLGSYWILNLVEALDQQKEKRDYLLRLLEIKRKGSGP